MQLQTKKFRYDLFFILALCHFAAFFLWQKQTTSLISSKPILHYLQFFVIKQDHPIVKPLIQKPVQIEDKKIIPKIIPKENKQIDDQKDIEILQDQNKSPVTETIFVTPNKQNPDNSGSTKLNLDVKTITKSMKEEFEKRDQTMRKKPFQEFGEAITDASLINHVGNKIESKHMYDGRPVSKVITPFGTYCIRHPKAGEKLELTPPAIPVTCGRL